MLLRKLKIAAARAVNYRFHVRRGDRKVTVPVINRVGRANLEWHEEHVYLTLERLFTPGTLLLDVGVNIGQTLIKYVLIGGPNVRYVGFEPNVKAAAYVDEIIHANGLKNAVVVPLGLGADRRLASLFMASADSTDPGASINQNFRDASFYGAKKIIPIFDADSALAALGIKDRNFIAKIDVEGAELEVLQGMEKTLRECRPYVIMEILPPAGFSAEVNEYRIKQAELLKETMRSLNYQVARLGEQGELGQGVGTNDYLFVPIEKTGSLGLAMVQ